MLIYVSEFPDVIHLLTVNKLTSLRDEWVLRGTGRILNFTNILFEQIRIPTCYGFNIG